MPAKLDRCVKHVMQKGHSESSAWAICRKSLGLTKLSEWKEVSGFEEYEVHPRLGIRRKGRDKILKGRTWIGYPKVTLMRDGKKHEVRVHRLVAEHFIPNPEGKPIVNHKDSNRSNFAVDNLEWVDNSGNQIHRWTTERNGMKKRRYEREYGLQKTSYEAIPIAGQNQPSRITAGHAVGGALGAFGGYKFAKGLSGSTPKGLLYGAGAGAIGALVGNHYQKRFKREGFGMFKSASDVNYSRQHLLEELKFRLRHAMLGAGGVVSGYGIGRAVSRKKSGGYLGGMMGGMIGASM